MPSKARGKTIEIETLVSLGGQEALLTKPNEILTHHARSERGWRDVVRNFSRTFHHRSARSRV